MTGTKLRVGGILEFGTHQSFRLIRGYKDYSFLIGWVKLCGVNYSGLRSQCGQLVREKLTIFYLPRFEIILTFKKVIQSKVPPLRIGTIFCTADFSRPVFFLCSLVRFLKTFRSCHGDCAHENQINTPL